MMRQAAGRPISSKLTISAHIYGYKIITGLISKVGFNFPLAGQIRIATVELANVCTF